MISSTPMAETPGLTVTVTFPRPMFSERDFAHARLADALAQRGERYQGPSQPHWYSPEALCQLLAAAPKSTPRTKIIADVFGIAKCNPRLTEDWAEKFIAQHPAPRHDEIGNIGADTLDGHYRKVTGRADFDGAAIPYCIEVWVEARHAEKDEDTRFIFYPLLNRSAILARVYGHADSTGLRLHGCGLDFKVSGPKRALYKLTLSLITPYLRLTGDGKAPFLGHFRAAIEDAVKDAAGKAYRNLVRPAAVMSIVDAAWVVMAEAYLKASDNGALPAKARQVMYAARGPILKLTGLKKFNDKYFTQTLLPEYVEANAEETGRWDVVWDARGHLTEPHTQRVVPLGTVAVREYLGLRAARPSRPRLQVSGLFPTIGPEHRYNNILFVEKEGFDELWAAVQLAERYDIALMSTKGMSVIAARRLLDKLVPQVDGHIFVLHDFDISGFTIFGTLGTNSPRYKFENDMSEKIIDIGLRLRDVAAMELEAETVLVDSRAKRRETLERHGATGEEIEFLAPYGTDEDCQRIELNAMTSRQLVDYVEQRLAQYGVEKVIPSDTILQEHARHLLEAKFTDELIAANAEEIAGRAATAKLPRDLADKIRAAFESQPELAWDEALRPIIVRPRIQRPRG